MRQSFDREIYLYNNDVAVLIQSIFSHFGLSAYNVMKKRVMPTNYINIQGNVDISFNNETFTEYQDWFDTNR